IQALVEGRRAGREAPGRAADGLRADALHGPGDDQTVRLAVRVQRSVTIRVLEGRPRLEDAGVPRAALAVVGTDDRRVVAARPHRKAEVVVRVLRGSRQDGDLFGSRTTRPTLHVHLPRSG